MELQAYQIDAFTRRVFQGNPAAVVPLRQWLPERLMQRIAMENNLSETAFFVPEGDRYHLRWFTPDTEVSLCGHATLATAHLLFTELGHDGQRICFHTASGLLEVTRADEGYRMRFPRCEPQPTQLDPYVCAAMGCKAEQQWQAGENVLLLYPDRATLERLQPDFPRLAETTGHGVIATTPGDGAFHFFSRFFAPALGVNEDPATGSAHCALAPFWGQRLGKQHLHALQCSPRRGWIDCILEPEHVILQGQAVLYARFQIPLPEPV